MRVILRNGAWLRLAVVMVAVLCAATLLAPHTAFAQASPELTTSGSPTAAQPDLFVDYPVAGSPKNVAAAPDGAIWFTLPAENKIGRLVITNPDSTPVAYALSYVSIAGQPYDLAIHGNYVWVTLLQSNKIARVDLTALAGVQGADVPAATDATTFYNIPTANSQPTGIAVGADGTVWFVERAGDNLGRLIPSTGIITEYTDKSSTDDNGVDLTGAQLEDVAVAAAGPWIVGKNLKTGVAYFRVDTQKFIANGTGQTALPVNSVAVDDADQVWIAATGRRTALGQSALNTLGLWRWFYLARINESNPTVPLGGPDVIAVCETVDGIRTIWYTREAAGNVGRQNVSVTNANLGVVEVPLPGANSKPWGIAAVCPAVQSAGAAAYPRVFVAATGVNRIVEWRFPYAVTLYLPVIGKSGS